MIDESALQALEKAIQDATPKIRMGEPTPLGILRSLHDQGYELVKKAAPELCQCGHTMKNHALRTGRGYCFESHYNDCPCQQYEPVEP